MTRDDVFSIVRAIEIGSESAIKRTLSSYGLIRPVDVYIVPVWFSVPEPGGVLSTRVLVGGRFMYDETPFSFFMSIPKEEFADRVIGRMSINAAQVIEHLI